MTLDLSYTPGPPPEIVPRAAGAIESWLMEGSAGGAVRIDAHLPKSVDRVVVMAHGADNDRRARYVEVAARSLTRHGSAVVAMDAPRHGDRPDAAPLSALPGVLPDLLIEWVRDHRRLLDAIEARWPGVPIGVAGVSMGGLFAVPLMAVETRLRAGAVLIAGSTRLSYPGRPEFDPSRADVLDATDPTVYAAATGDRPVLLLAAERDEIVPRRSVEALASAFTGPHRVVFLPGTHTEWGRPTQWFRLMERFFREAL